jgi:hypothetical protein
MGCKVSLHNFISPYGQSVAVAVGCTKMLTELSSFILHVAELTSACASKADSHAFDTFNFSSFDIADADVIRATKATKAAKAKVKFFIYFYHLDYVDAPI